MVKRGKAEKWAARSERLATSLRENLKRRKAQARGRAGGHAAEEKPRPGEGASEAAEPDFRRNRDRN